MKFRLVGDELQCLTCEDEPGWCSCKGYVAITFLQDEEHAGPESLTMLEAQLLLSAVDWACARASNDAIRQANATLANANALREQRPRYVKRIIELGQKVV